MTIYDQIKALASVDPTATALTFVQKGEDVVLSRADFSALVESCAGYLASIGVEPASVCILFFDHQPICYASFFAAMRLGAIPTFMPPLTAKQEPLAFWLSHKSLFDLIDPAVIVIPERELTSVSQALASFRDHFVCYEHISARDDATAYHTSGNNIAFLQHSSGTTGQKKGVALSHEAVTAHTHAYAEALQLTPKDRIVSWLPPYHDMGLIACLLLPLLTGTSVTLIDRLHWLEKPQILFESIERFGSTLCWMPNFAFAHMANLSDLMPASDLSGMRLFINCSEPCRPASFERFLAAFAGHGVEPKQLSTCYAMAETVFAVSQSRPGHVARHIGEGTEHPPTLSSGQVLAGLDVRIGKEPGAQQKPGTRGEIWIKGRWLFSEYYRKQALTAARFFDGWYRTGDLGLRDESGELFVLGRDDDLLIINGKNFFAHEIEDALNEINALIPGRNLAIGIEDAEAGTRKLVVLAETEADSQPHLKREIRYLVNQRFSIRPSRIVLLGRGQLRKTTSGKINRKINSEIYLKGQLISEEFCNVA